MICPRRSIHTPHVAPFIPVESPNGHVQIQVPLTCHDIAILVAHLAAKRLIQIATDQQQIAIVETLVIETPTKVDMSLILCPSLIRLLTSILTIFLWLWTGLDSKTCCPPFWSLLAIIGICVCCLRLGFGRLLVQLLHDVGSASRVLKARDVCF